MIIDTSRCTWIEVLDQVERSMQKFKKKIIWMSMVDTDIYGIYSATWVHLEQMVNTGDCSPAAQSLNDGSLINNIQNQLMDLVPTHVVQTNESGILMGKFTSCQDRVAKQGRYYWDIILQGSIFSCFVYHLKESNYFPSFFTIFLRMFVQRRIALEYRDSISLQSKR